MDVLSTTSPTSPTLPSGYTHWRYLGSVQTNTSAQNFSFTNPTSGVFRRKTLSLDLGAATATTTSATAALPTITNGHAVRVRLNVRAINTASSVLVYIRCPDDTDSAPSFTANPLGSIGAGVANASFIGQVVVWTDASRQVAYRATGNTTLDMSVVEWEDPWVLQPP